MKTIALRTTEGRFIAHEVRIASSLRARLLGLARERSLPTRGGLLLSAAHGVHTLGMRFAIDVVFLSRQMRVLALAPVVPPWRVLLAPRGTGRVLELAAGQIAATGLKTGTFILVETSRPQQCERLPIRFSLRLPRQEDCAATQEASASSRRSLPQ
ncbi:MAG TPA: DUF192 domain-containing protein [Steroidobacteraceae bacterium]|jgi:hypothetical protein